MKNMMDYMKEMFGRNGMTIKEAQRFREVQSKLKEDPALKEIKARVKDMVDNVPNKKQNDATR